MSRLQVEAEATVRAEPGAVWALVSDATRYPEWGPWSAAGYRQPGDTSPRGPGAVYWLKSADRAYGRYVTTVEKVLEVEEARRLAYTVVGGMPVRNYRGEVTLTSTADGTHIRWTASWDSTVTGRLVLGGLRAFFPRVTAGLAAAVGKEARPNAEQDD
jgi:uncharacterized protein YndB with AHSA1/START domain